jgi:hypothetical protein
MTRLYMFLQFLSFMETVVLYNIVGTNGRMRFWGRDEMVYLEFFIL